MITNMDLANFIEIDGYNGMYLVDVNGNVYSRYANRTLKQNIYHGYWRVILYDGVSKRQVSHYVHRLIATYFIPNPSNLPVVNHKDENKLNNDINNLEWCTTAYNNTYNGLHKRRGAAISKAITESGGAWNKGKKMSQAFKENVRAAAIGRPFKGNQYVDSNGMRRK